MYVDAVIESIKDGMIEDGKVQIVGFGTFEVKERAEREGRNPATNQPMLIPATRVLKFKVGAKLKEEINK